MSQLKDRTLLQRKFFSRPAEVVAQELLGNVLVHRIASKVYKAKIVETEAYVGPEDLACHAAKGRTARTEIMFGPAGFAYVYFIYGMYEMLNVVTGKKNHPQAVLIRAAEAIEPTDLDLSGPGKLTRALKITRRHNGLDLCKSDELYFEKGVKPASVAVTPRIGVDYAAEWKEKPLRFIDAKSSAISKHQINKSAQVLSASS